MFKELVLISAGAALLYYVFSKPKGRGRPKVTCRSSRDPNVKYEISPERQTCTCPDWKERRSSYALNDPRRFCKHLNICFENMNFQLPPALAPFEDMLQHFGLEQKGTPIGADSEIVVVEDKTRGGAETGMLAVRKNPDDDWVNVYFSSLRYGYNQDEDRWSYGNEPPYADELIQNLQIFKKRR